MCYNQTMHTGLYFQQIIHKSLISLLNADTNAQDIEVSVPTHATFGDYATNIALKQSKNIAKEHYHSPMEFANQLSAELSRQDYQKRFSSFEVANPGFINARISKEYLFRSQLLIQQSNNNQKKKKRILVEFVGPNTNKQLHIGHVLNAVIGHSIINILRRAGYDVTAGTISNDRGIHIMKSMYGYLRSAHSSSISKNDTGELVSTPLSEIDYTILIADWLNKPSLWKTPKEVDSKPDHFIGWCYIQGNKLSEDNELVQEQMQKMLLAWENGDEDVRTLWMQTNIWFYEGYHQTLHSLNIYASQDGKSFFDHVWYESEVYKKGKEIILKNIGNGLIKEYEDGHVEAELEDKYGIPNIVLLRKDKSALYITQDIELLRNRLQDFKFDQVVYVVDYRQKLQFQQLFKVVASFGVENALKCIHKAYGEVRTPQGAMSSRKGNIITADWLIEETEKRALSEINTQQHDFNELQKKEIAHYVALAAIKYGLLKYNSITNIVFDINTNVSFDGDTGPYIQYTHARCASILQKSNKDDLNISKDIINEILQNESKLYQEINILRTIEKFEYAISISAQEMAPNVICEYLFNLCQQFNSFYSIKKIIKEEDNLLRKARLFLVYETKNTLKQGLDLLGIKALEEM